jgi:hypothetical protein
MIEVAFNTLISEISDFSFELVFLLVLIALLYGGVPYYISKKAESFIIRLLYTSIGILIFSAGVDISEHILVNGLTYTSIGLIYPHIRYFINFFINLVIELKYATINSYFFMLTIFFKTLNLIKSIKELFDRVGAFFTKDKSDSFDSKDSSQKQKESDEYYDRYSNFFYEDEQEQNKNNNQQDRDSTAHDESSSSGFDEEAFRKQQEEYYRQEQQKYYEQDKRDREEYAKAHQESQKKKKEHRKSQQKSKTDQENQQNQNHNNDDFKKQQEEQYKQEQKRYEEQARKEQEARAKAKEESDRKKQEEQDRQRREYEEKVKEQEAKRTPGYKAEYHDGIPPELKQFYSLDPYIVLGVSKDDDFKTITNQYRKLAFKYHSDRVGNEYLEVIQFINGAYKELKKRKG